MNPVRVLIVDDHEVVRVGLGTLLSSVPSVEVVGAASSVSQAIEETKRLLPDVVLLDVRLGDESGFDVCREIQKLDHEIRVLVLTSFADDNIVIEAISAGADGYLLKEVNREALVSAIEKVAAGQSVLDPAVTGRVFGKVQSLVQNPTGNKLTLLSAQERRVLALVAEGKTNKEIAAAMGLSDKTIKNYFSNILDKLQMTRRSQAAAYFVQHTFVRT
ncbi:MAG TPA: response regulator transcription factor [Verrucomicrobiae bacterium]|jgi:DNA-binding NarL/FixJ family response regulator|nr:response regulator transcription factor [Verrucomicrobiae bacterium]